MRSSFNPMDSNNNNENYSLEELSLLFPQTLATNYSLIDFDSSSSSMNSDPMLNLSSDSLMSNFDPINISPTLPNYMNLPFHINERPAVENKSEEHLDDKKPIKKRKRKQKELKSVNSTSSAKILNSLPKVDSGCIPLPLDPFLEVQQMLASNINLYNQQKKLDNQISTSPQKECEMFDEFKEINDEVNMQLKGKRFITLTKDGNLTKEDEELITKKLKISIDNLITVTDKRQHNVFHSSIKIPKNTFFYKKSEKTNSKKYALLFDEKDESLTPVRVERETNQVLICDYTYNGKTYSKGKKISSRLAYQLSDQKISVITDKENFQINLVVFKSTYDDFHAQFKNLTLQPNMTSTGLLLDGRSKSSDPSQLESNSVSSSILKNNN